MAAVAATAFGWSACAEDVRPAWDGVVRGLDISRVSLTQGVSFDLEGVAEDETAIVVAGRDALVRAHVTPHEDWTPTEVEATLTVLHGEELVWSSSEARWVERHPVLGRPASTFAFTVPGHVVLPGLELEVRLDYSSSPQVGDPPSTVGRTTWAQRRLEVVDTDEITIVVIPVVTRDPHRERVPDTRPETLERYRDRVFSMFPVRAVTIRSALPIYVERMTGTDAEWSSLLAEISDLRGRADLPPNTYFHGTFVPSGRTSIAGMALLGRLGDPSTKASIGLGLGGDESANVFAHELAHNHGRMHAPCGNPSRVDIDFPYADGGIGTWGYDLLTGHHKNPLLHRDLMSYCPKEWVSDYTWVGIAEFLRLNREFAELRSAPTTLSRFLVTLGGEVVPQGTFALSRPPDGEPVEVRVQGADGEERVPGILVATGDSPAAMVWIPARSDAWTAELVSR